MASPTFLFLRKVHLSSKVSRLLLLEIINVFRSTYLLNEGVCEEKQLVREPDFLNVSEDDYSSTKNFWNYAHESFMKGIKLSSKYKIPLLYVK